MHLMSTVIIDTMEPSHTISHFQFTQFITPHISLFPSSLLHPLSLSPPPPSLSFSFSLPPPPSRVRSHQPAIKC